MRSVLESLTCDIVDVVDIEPLYKSDRERDQRIVARIERYNFDPMHFKDNYVGQQYFDREQEDDDEEEE